MQNPKSLRIVYMGTPEFAVEPLRLLVNEGYNVVAVITVPDKPAGRGQKLSQSAVKQFADEKKINVLQPQRLKDIDLVNELQSLEPDIFIVVAFRMLPEMIWNIPRIGTFNLHASLLPNYRGAAPINWAIINGETETGVTTFLIDQEIDTGKILLNEKVSVGRNETAGELHDRLMPIGANLVLKTVNALAKGQIEPMAQDALLIEGVSVNSAPKLFKETTRIKWDKPVDVVYNFIKGLSPYPAAWTELESPDGSIILTKIFLANPTEFERLGKAGEITTDAKSYLMVNCGDKKISITEIQIAGKRRMPISDFLLGFRGIENYRFT
jgi:methionyl-tRNA formyltransferase